MGDLPYTFEMPKDHAAFKKLVKGRSVEQLQVIIHRIRVCHDSTLGPENKAKMEVTRLLHEKSLITLLWQLTSDMLFALFKHFFGVLFDHFGFVAAKGDMGAVDVLTHHLFQISQPMPDSSAKVVRQKLTDMNAGLTARLTTLQCKRENG